MEDPTEREENWVDPWRTEGERGLEIDQDTGMVQTDPPVGIIQEGVARVSVPVGEGKGGRVTTG